MRLFVSVAVLSLALATSVSARPAPDQPAAQPTSNETPAPAKANGGDKKKDGVVCRKEIPTGSQFPVKVCTTVEERRAQQRTAQRVQETMQRPTEVVPN